MLTSSSIADKQAGRFLSEFVNRGSHGAGWRESLDSFSWFSVHPLFSWFLPRVPSRLPDELRKRLSLSQLPQWRFYFWQNFLRTIWAERPARSRETALMAAIGQYCAYLAGFKGLSRDAASGLSANPRVRRAFGEDAFLRILFRATNFVSTMRVCRNPDCQRPFFIAERATQKICLSRECKNWADRRYKRRSWKRHGHEWRPAKAARGEKSQKRGKRR